MADLTGKIAVVTGGASGIGLETARLLGRKGATAVIADIDGEMAAASVSQLRGEGLKAAAFRLDVADRDGCRALADEIGQSFGPIAVLVNNAGVVGGARLGDSDSARQWDRSIDVNLTGLYNVTTAFLDGLKATKGVIVNVSSVVAFTSGLSQAGYTASKGGVRSLTQAMCRELTAFGLRINAVAPGYIDTPMLASGNAKLDSWIDFHCPMKRYGRPEEVARVIAFLCSDEASFVNGATIPVDGGYLVV